MGQRSGVDEEHEPVVVLVAFVPRLRDVARFTGDLAGRRLTRAVGVLIGDYPGGLDIDRC